MILLTLPGTTDSLADNHTKLPASPPPQATTSQQKTSGTATEVEVPPPPLSEDIFPCTQCHSKEMAVNPERRILENYHTEIVLKHDEEHRWCLDCHAPDNRDKLRLASGTLIDFTESYKLCGQCHGPTLRDWKAGIHGKRTGNWNGHKQYLLCVHCHNPHAPKYPPLTPEPPPVTPEQLR